MSGHLPPPVSRPVLPAARPGVDGARVLMNLPTRRPSVLPARADRVLQSHRVPTQLSLFPTPGQLMAGAKR